MSDIKFKDKAVSAIENASDTFKELADSIWEYAELSLKEYKSAELYCKVLAKLGFEVETGICGIPTAFLGKYGQGRPYIAVLGEFDALSGLSQVGGSIEKKPLEEGSTGHGCGHNLLGAGALAAAYGIKEYLRARAAEGGKDVAGTVFFFGTPGEEGGAGKAFMARNGLWKSMDAALTWHPGDSNQVVTGTCNSTVQVLYKFKGIAAHAAGNPESGRSALDAVELMNIGVQYLREHMKDGARIHYAMIDGGGYSPNVVQPTASVLYMIRSKLVKDVLELEKRVDKIADGAALMTETEYEKIFIDGCANTVPNHTLEALLFKNMEALGAPKYTKEETEFAAALRKTYVHEGDIGDALPTIAANNDEKLRAEVAKLSDNGKKPLNDFISPLYTGYAFSAGSTDVGDVSWQTPTAQINCVTFPSGCPGHSWQYVSCGKTSIAYKGMLYAAKVLAGTAIDLFENTSTLSTAKEEFGVAAKGGYVCPIPDGETAKAIL